MASTPKTMSSRLATMKFMQRSASKNSPSQPSTPNGPPSSKKVRLSNGSSAPGTPSTPSDHDAIKAALEAEERKRQEALDKASANAGETKWVLSYNDPKDGSRAQGMNVVQTGFADIDADDESDEGEVQSVRMRFGGGVKKEKEIQAQEEDSDDSEDSSDPSDFDSDDPTAELIRETKRETATKAKEGRKALKREEDDRPRKPPAPIDEDMDLGGLTSLSGGGGSGGGGRGNANVECFNCRQKGHISSKCPQKGGQSGRGFAGRGGRGGQGRRR